MHQSSNSRHEYCIKVLVNLNLQPRRHTDTYYSYFHKPDESNSLNDSFLKKKISDIFFQIWHLFSILPVTATTNKLDDVAHF